MWFSAGSGPCRRREARPVDAPIFEEWSFRASNSSRSPAAATGMAALSSPSTSFSPRLATSTPKAIPFTVSVPCASQSLFFRSENHGYRRLRRPLLRRPRLAGISAVQFEELVEKDWSFLDPIPAENPEERAGKFDRIIAAAGVAPESRVLACFPSAGFIDHLVETRPCELLIATHDSLFLLAEIKERHDAVRCWQGGVDAVPERFSPFNVAFICYFPAMGVSIEQLLRSLALRCSPGTRAVIGCEQGREGVERHRQQHPDMVTSDLPDHSSLEQAAAENSFRLVELVDESSLYLAVLELSAS